MGYRMYAIEVRDHRKYFLEWDSQNDDNGAGEISGTLAVVLAYLGEKFSGNEEEYLEALNEALDYDGNYKKPYRQVSLDEVLEVCDAARAAALQTPS